MTTRLHIPTFLRNLKWSFSRNNVEERAALERRISKLEGIVERLRPESTAYRELLLLEDVLNGDEPQFAEEREYCRRHGRLRMFPYEEVREFPEVEVCYDRTKGLPYVVHDGKRLYYPAAWGTGTITYNHISSVAVEGILGGGCLAKSPHNYLDARFPVRDGAVVCDFGAAEGLVGLHLAECASRIVIGECDEKWLPPLKATFEPYAGKTAFVTEPLGRGGGGRGYSRILEETVSDAENGKPFFLKFDIEGAERFAIREAEEFFKNQGDVTVACAVYHRQDDGKQLEKLFKGWGYETAFSRGAMLVLPDRLAPPYFRQGVIYARKGRNLDEVEVTA